MHLHRRTVSIVRTLQSHFGTVIPEMNMAPVLSNMVDAMLLPPTLYVATKSLLSFLRIDAFLTNETFASVSRQESKSGSSGRFAPSAGGTYLGVSPMNSKVPRCVMYMAVLILAIRLRWGLDGYARPEYDQELGGNRVNSDTPPQHAWLDALDANSGSADSSVHAPFCPWDTSADMLNMSETDIDRYLDFLDTNYRTTHLPNILRTRERQDIGDFLSFARHEPGNEPRDQIAEWHAVKRARRSHTLAIRQELYATPHPTPVSGQIYLAPGEAIQLNSTDLFGVVHRDMERVLRAAQRVLSLDMDTEARPLWRTSELDDHDILALAVQRVDDMFLRFIHARVPSPDAQSLPDHDSMTSEGASDTELPEQASDSNSDSSTVSTSRIPTP